MHLKGLIVFVTPSGKIDVGGGEHDIMENCFVYYLSEEEWNDSTKAAETILKTIGKSE